MVRSASRGWVRSAVKLTNKNVLITGANAGLGYETALDFAERDARVIIACRDESKAAAAKEQIQKATGSQKIFTRRLDLSSFSSIRQFSEDFNRTEDRLDILINNAGIMKHPQAKTEDGFEMHFGVNHLGPFLLTNLLLDIMKTNKGGRIVNVSSIVNYLGRIKWSDLNWEKRRYSPMGAYNASKLMNVLFTRELANRIRGLGITTNSIHPGVVNTTLNRTGGQDLSIMGRLTDFIFNQNFLTISPKQGAQCQIYAAIAPELQNVSGKYFSGCRKLPVGFWNATSSKSAARLWKISEELTGLKS